jgi:hypothetical protein
MGYLTSKDGICSVMGKLPSLQPGRPAKPWRSFAAQAETAVGNVRRLQHQLHVKVLFLTSKKTAELHQLPKGTASWQKLTELGKREGS